MLGLFSAYEHAFNDQVMRRGKVGRTMPQGHGRSAAFDLELRLIGAKILLRLLLLGLSSCSWLCVPVVDDLMKEKKT